MQGFHAIYNMNIHTEQHFLKPHYEVNRDKSDNEWKGNNF